MQQINELESKENEVVDMYYEDILEKNKSNVEVTIFESEYSRFQETIEEDKLINPIETKIDVNYRYKVAVDLSGAKVVKRDNKNIVNIDKSLIYLSSIETNNHELNSDINFLNGFSGKKVEKLNNDILRVSTESINRLVKQDYEKRYNDIVGNIQSKLEFFYGVNGEYLEVNVNEK